MPCKRDFLKNLAKFKSFKTWPHAKLKASVLVPLVTVNDQPSILFITRPQHLVYPGQVSFPGGKFDQDLDKTVEDTAIRETFEETGISPNQLDLWGTLPQTSLDKTGHMLIHTCVGKVSNVDDDEQFRIDDKFLSKVNRDEVDKIFPVSLEHLTDPKNFRLKTYERSKPPKETWTLPIYTITVDGVEEEIWGLTAFQLNMVLQLLGSQEILFDFR